MLWREKSSSQALQEVRWGIPGNDEKMCAQVSFHSESDTGAN